MKSKNQPTNAKPDGFMTKLGRHCSGPWTQLALQATSAWLIVTGAKGAAGFAIDTTSAAADLLGIVVVMGALRWMQGRRKPT